jgi:hypothetical protein
LILEQVHVRGINRRGLRLELVAGVAIALVLPALAVSQGVATTTTLNAGTLSGCTQTLTVTVSETASGNPVANASVNINDAFNGGSSVLLTKQALTTNAQGTASTSACLQPGDHSLSATFAGTSADQLSSAALELNIDFEPAVSNISPASSAGVMTLTPGQAGTATVTVTPSEEFLATVTATNTPAFITISCSGLSDMAACNFTPQNVEIDPGQSGGVSSDLVIQTYAASGASLNPASKPGRNSAPIAWALLLPGVLGLGGLAFGVRRRRFLSRLSLAAMVGLVTVLGTTGCNPRYNYEHHGPAQNQVTPAGNYTVLVTAQYSNGVTAAAQSTTLALTVK